MSVRIILCGACGKMGGNVLSLLENDEEAKVVCGVDLYPREIGVPVYTSFALVKEDADVIVDFSSPVGLQERLEYAKAHNLGIVLASTGFSADDLKMIDEYAKSVAIFKTANLSLGINLMQALIKAAAEVLGASGETVGAETAQTVAKATPQEEEAISALMGLGFTRAESAQAVKKAKDNGANSVEEIIMKALQGV